MYKEIYLHNYVFVDTFLSTYREVRECLYVLINICMYVIVYYDHLIVMLKCPSIVGLQQFQPLSSSSTNFIIGILYALRTPIYYPIHTSIHINNNIHIHTYIYIEIIGKEITALMADSCSGQMANAILASLPPLN